MSIDRLQPGVSTNSFLRGDIGLKNWGFNEGDIGTSQSIPLEELSAKRTPLRINMPDTDKDRSMNLKPLVTEPTFQIPSYVTKLDKKYTSEKNEVVKETFLKKMSVPTIIGVIIVVVILIFLGYVFVKALITKKSFYLVGGDVEDIYADITKETIANKDDSEKLIDFVF